MLEPLCYSIDVPCNQQKAFEVFIDMETWWPLDKRSVSARNGKLPKSLSLEPKVGGKITEIAWNDKEHLWGSIKTYEPFDVFSMGFHLGLPETKEISLVEVRFTVINDTLTHVELTQSNWEAFGDLAEMMRGGYGSSWGLIFEQAYKAACHQQKNEE